jgi:hypothetical protein
VADRISRARVGIGPAARVTADGRRSRTARPRSPANDWPAQTAGNGRRGRPAERILPRSAAVAERGRRRGHT